MKKTLTKRQIKKEAKKIERDLRKLYNRLDNLGKLYNRLDNLMDEAETSALALSKEKLSDGLGVEFNSSARIIERSRDYAELAIDELSSLNPFSK